LPSQSKNEQTNPIPHPPHPCREGYYLLVFIGGERVVKFLH
jgi:hypothetical protein